MLCDKCGAELPEDAKPIPFSVGNKRYEADLCEKDGNKLNKALEAVGAFADGLRPVDTLMAPRAARKATAGGGGGLVAADLTSEEKDRLRTEGLWSGRRLSAQAQAAVLGWRGKPSPRLGLLKPMALARGVVGLVPFCLVVGSSLGVR